MLVLVAPLLTRWIERLLAATEPPLTVAQFLALRAIATEGVSGGELAHRTGVSGSAVSQLLSGLVDAGLLERSELAEDRRRQTLTLSTDGRRALQGAHASLSDHVSSLIAELAPLDAEALDRALSALAATLSGQPPPRRPRPPRPPPPHRAPHNNKRH